MILTRLVVLKNRLFNMIEGGWFESLYRWLCVGLLFCFLSVRVPYIYGVFGFGLSIFFIIFPIFLSLFLCRIINVGISQFFSSLVPEGTPLWVAPFVCLAETLSYIVRPFVLMLRPFVNLTIGFVGGCVLGSCSSFSWLGFVVLFVLFFYEIFVASIHWFIVCSILSFSESH